MRKKKTVDVFLISLGIVLIVESIYFFGFFYSFYQAAKTFGMRMSPFVAFTYCFIIFKFAVGVAAIVRGKNTSKR